MSLTPHEQPPGVEAARVTPAAVDARTGSTAEALAAARVRLEHALETCPCTLVPADEADPEAAARDASAAYVASAQETGLLPDAAAAVVLAPLAERLQTADSIVEARQRAERAIEWALLAARRHAWSDAPAAAAAEIAPPAA